jgi:plastocyanin
MTISITLGASTKTTDAYDPNPAAISQFSTITWRNDDDVPHTVTSGVPGFADGNFTSLIIPPNGTYTHTFFQPGQYQYFCELHPNMEGLIFVGEAVGGEILGTDVTALLVAGTVGNMNLIVPIVVAIAAISVFAVVKRQRPD